MVAMSQVALNRPKWQTTVIFTLAFWLSACVILDFAIVPSLYAAGMMAQPSFASAGYTLFWVFNRLELVCAALAMTGVLVLWNTHQALGDRVGKAIILSALLLILALVDTYALTPYMSGLGMQLNLFDRAAEVPGAMNQMHGAYWGLEVLKLAAAGWLLNLCYRQEAKAE